MSWVASAASPIAAGHRAGPTARSLRRRREVLTAYLLLAPAVLLVLGVLAYPFVWEVWVSLTNVSVRHLSSDFVGLQNYLDALGNPGVWLAIRNTIGYITLTSTLKLAVGVAVAVVLWRPFAGRPLVFLAAFLPWAYPAGVGVIGWYLFTLPPVHTSYSALMSGLRVVFDARLGDGTWGFLSLIVFNVWRGGSFIGIFLLAALNGIPHDLFDYAALEAPSAWRQFWMVTVPLLRPFLALATFLSLTTAVVDLGNVWIQTGGRDTYPVIWTQAFHSAILAGQWGKASALSLILLPPLLGILLACFRLFETHEEEVR